MKLQRSKTYRNVGGCAGRNISFIVKVPEHFGKEIEVMKKFLAASLLFAVSAVAENLSGYIVDKNCAGKAAMLGNEACAKRCIKGGAPAVMVSGDKVYTIAADSQAKAIELAGKKVKVDAKVDGDTITINSISAE